MNSSAQEKGSASKNFEPFQLFWPWSLFVGLFSGRIGRKISASAFSVTAERRQLSLLRRVQPQVVNRGYQDWEDLVIDTVDGVTLRDRQHLAGLFDGAEGRRLEIVIDNDSHLTPEPEQARKAQPTILSNFGISRDRSAGLGRHSVTARAAPQ